MKQNLKRREFVKLLPAAGLAFTAGCTKSPPASPYEQVSNPPSKSVIALHRTSDRKEGVKTLMNLLDIPVLSDQKVLVKPNFNTADPTPASTHNDTLSQIMIELQSKGATDITLGERSFQPFAEVISIKKIDQMATQVGFEILNLNMAEKSRFTHDKMSWQNGFDFPQIINNSDYMVCTGCLKTHSSGGVFTMSLKLSVGLLPTSFMDELHSSAVIRNLIAEINLAYKPNLIIMDGIDVFISGGPSIGTLRSPGVMIAGTDRVALDAAGVAILKEQGSGQVAGKIFEQDQIVRAIELGLGISHSNRIDFITADETSRQYANKIQDILALG